MTDIEISKALALAIGWPKGDVITTHWDVKVVTYRSHHSMEQHQWRNFDYRDWNVIGPIAERYDCFPIKLREGTWESASRAKYTTRFVSGDTPQKAIALAVIGAKK